MIVSLSVLVSATTATRCYLCAADGILGSASVRQLLLHAQCTQGMCSLELWFLELLSLQA